MEGTACYLGVPAPEACADDPELCAGEGEDEPDEEDPECEAPENEEPEDDAPPPDECVVPPDEPEYDDPECDEPECDDDPLSAVCVPELDPLPPPLLWTWVEGDDDLSPEFLAMEVSVPGVPSGDPCLCSGDPCALTGTGFVVANVPAPPPGPATGGGV
jgi:hypothetical protein